MSLTWHDVSRARSLILPRSQSLPTLYLASIQNKRKGRFASDQDYLLVPDHTTNDNRGGGDTRGFGRPIFSGLTSRQRAAAAGAGMVDGGSSGRGVFLNESLTSRGASWRRRQVKASALPVVKFGRSSRDVESG